MSPFANARQQPDYAERRSVQRFHVDFPGRLKMLGGDRDGRLSDLSEAGARFETAKPPSEGTSGLLEWGNHEYFCKVVWANENSCGVRFERPIPFGVVESSGRMVEVQSGPVARFANIPLAKKGSRRAAMLRSVE